MNRDNLYRALVLSVTSFRREDGLEKTGIISQDEAFSEIKKGVYSTNEYIRKVYSESPFKTADDIIRKCQKENISIVSSDDPVYPALLKEIHRPPGILYIRGSFSNSRRYVAVVGTRKSDKKSEDITREIVSSLGKMDFSVVSGMALGIDRAAHLAALKTGCGTAAVLPNAVDVVYPYSNRDIVELILKSDNSSLISEFPPGVVPGQKWVFARRNRLISGISLGIVIVKAPVKSGAMITARYAMEQNREVFACPGHAFDPAYGGCHSLIKEGAIMLTSMDDLFNELNPSSLFNFNYSRNPGEKEGRENFNSCQSVRELSHQEKKLVNILSKDGVDIDYIIRTMDEGAEIISRIVTTLQIEGIVDRVGNRVFLC